MPNLIGQSLGRYHILEQLGEGGMAVVYKAYDTRLETDVAVKIIRTENLPQSGVERARKRFEREAKALAKLTHPNIVPIIDYGEYEGRPYLVMKYLPGGTLKQRLGHPLPCKEAVRILVPIARALEYAHQQGIVHRDVKPSNILITESSQPMLSDFGVAKILEADETMDLTGTSMGVGTPEYMAPEQAGRNFDHRVDIYALGIVFYEMLTGQRPFEADTPLAVLIKQASEPIPRPGQFVRGLPDAVEKVLLKGLAKKPEERYQSMNEFEVALERLVSGQNVGAGRKLEGRSKKVEEEKQEKPLRLAGHPQKSIKWVFIGILVALVALGVVLGIGMIGTDTFSGLSTHIATATYTSILTLTYTPTLTRTSTQTPTMTFTATPIPTSTPLLAPVLDLPYNLDFENKKGWVVRSSSVFFLGKYSGEWASHGSQSFKLYIYKYPNSDPTCKIYFTTENVHISQYVDLTGVNSITFDLNPIDSSLWVNSIGLALDTYIDNNLIWSTTKIPNVLLNHMVSIGNWNGVHNLQFRLQHTSTLCWAEGKEHGLYIDNLRFTNNISSTPTP